MGLRRLLQLLLRVRDLNARSEHQIDGAISEVKRQQDIAQRLKRLELDLEVHADKRYR